MIRRLEQPCALGAPRIEDERCHLNEQRRWSCRPSGANRCFFGAGPRADARGYFMPSLRDSRDHGINALSSDLDSTPSFTPHSELRIPHSPWAGSIKSKTRSKAVSSAPPLCCGPIFAICSRAKAGWSTTRSWRICKVILIKTDMGVAAAAGRSSTKSHASSGPASSRWTTSWPAIKAKLKELMAQDGRPEPIRFAATGPTVIMVVGVNGTGKTTSIAKLAHLFAAQGKKVVLGAGDTFRAAAVEQLTIWAERLGVRDRQRASRGAIRPASPIGPSRRRSRPEADVCIVDTAGRLQTQPNLMQELTKIHRVIGKQIPDAPHEVLLVLDATTGQNGISQARSFTEAVQVHGHRAGQARRHGQGGRRRRRSASKLDLPVKYHRRRRAARRPGSLRRQGVYRGAVRGSGRMTRGRARRLLALNRLRSGYKPLRRLAVSYVSGQELRWIWGTDS